MVKWLATRRFNYIDITTLSVVFNALSSQHYSIAGIVVLIGLVTSLSLEMKLNKE